MTFWRNMWEVGEGGGIAIIRKMMRSLEKSGVIIWIDENISVISVQVSLLPSTKPAEVQSIHQWSPEKLETKRPEDKAEKGLVFVTDILTLQDQRDAATQSKRNPLKHIEKQKQQHVSQLTAYPRPARQPSQQKSTIFGFLFYFRLRGVKVHVIHVFW